MLTDLLLPCLPKQKGMEGTPGAVLYLERLSQIVRPEGNSAALYLSAIDALEDRIMGLKPSGEDRNNLKRVLSSISEERNCSRDRKLPRLP